MHLHCILSQQILKFKKRDKTADNTQEDKTMKKFPVALQLYSVRDFMTEDFEGTIKKVKEMGYDGIEFAGTYGKTASEIRKICSEVGINPISAHVPYLEMMQDPDKSMRYYREIGCEYIAIPYLLEEYRPGAPLFDDVIRNAAILGKAANNNGLRLMYHNHDFEFVKINGEYALDVLYREVPAELLAAELDMCWVNVGGENPSEYLRKYAGRAPVVHLKDFTGSKSDSMFELIGIENAGKVKTPSAAFEFRPLGYGVQDFAAILEAADDAGAEWVVVEQDRPSGENTSLECAKMSIDYLSTINK